MDLSTSSVCSMTLLTWSARGRARRADGGRHGQRALPPHVRAAGLREPAGACRARERRRAVLAYQEGARGRDTP